MSRTPTMPTNEIESLLGPRGSLQVTTDNRPLARKWLTAQGLPSLFVGGLAMRAIAAAYNETDGKALERLRAQAAEATGDETTPNATPSAPYPGSPAKEITRADLARFEPAGDAVTQAMQTLLSALGQNGMDANAVRAIVRDELPNLIPVTRLEIKTAEGTKDHGPAPRHKQLPDLIMALSAGLNVALVGPAGSGKTTAVEQAAEILESEFYIQGAVQGAHDLVGYCDAHGNYHRTPTRDAFEHGGIACWDEMDAGDAAGLLVANSATANGYMAFPDQAKPVMKHAKFQAVANMNTFGNGADRLYVGRSQMDAATLDRFVFIAWEYDEVLERAIAGNDAWTLRVQALRHGAMKEKARVVISPRASIHGAKLLAAGMTMSKVEDATIWRGMDSELRRRIEASAK